MSPSARRTTRRTRPSWFVSIPWSELRDWPPPAGSARWRDGALAVGVGRRWPQRAAADGRGFRWIGRLKRLQRAGVQHEATVAVWVWPYGHGLLSFESSNWLLLLLLVELFSLVLAL